MDGQFLGGSIQINTNPTGHDSPNYLTAVGSNLFLSAYNNGYTQYDLWMSVNSSGGATGVNTDPTGHDDPVYLTAVGSNLFVRALEQWRRATGPVDGQFLGGGD